MFICFVLIILELCKNSDLMTFGEDINKNLEVCMATKGHKTADLMKYYRSIENAQLHERAAYKKKIELLLLTTLFHHYPNLEIENLICESPDFIININGRQIGLEVSEIINHFELKKRENFINVVFRDVEAELQSYNSLCGMYYLDIDYTDPLIFTNQSRFTKDILSAITNNKKTRFVKNIRRTPYPKGVLLFLEYRFSLFDELDSEKILEVIEKKNAKYPLYHSNAEECWLLLVSNMYNVSSRYSFIQSQERLQSVQSPFSKILHVENLHRGLLVIK